MIRLFSLLSLLFYTAYAQCTTSHSQSGQTLLLSVSVNGKQVGKLGVSEYLSIVEAAANAIAPSTGRMGLNIFGGTVAPIVATQTKLNLGTNTWSGLQSAISNLETTDFDAHWGNSVSDAIQFANNASWTGQRYHVLFSAGIPLSTGWGTATTSLNFQDPCTDSIAAKKNNIQQYVVLIGVEGVHFIKEYFSCMVEDPANDIIEIDPSSTAAGIAKLAARVCKTDGIDIKITEVNPVDGAYVPFIEVLNRGAPTSISVCWDAVGCTNGTTTATGSYYVGYGTGNGADPTGESGLAINLGGENGWTATAKAGSMTDTVAKTTAGIQNLLLGNTGQQTGRSFELRAVGYNNDYGMNWRVSCGSNRNGSPGSGPSDCTELDNSCSTSDCGKNGASITACVGAAATLSLCQCPNTYLEDINACIHMTGPSSSECNTYVIYDEVAGKDYTYFAFPRASFDGDVAYGITYPSTSGTKTWDVGGVSAGAVQDVSSSVTTSSTVGITVTTKYKSPIRNTAVSTEIAMTCSVNTAQPSGHPTVSPTDTPSLQRTPLPTQQPTHDLPGVYLADLCIPSRCQCFGNVRECCTPFGPQFGPSLTSGIIPAKECHHVFKEIQITNKEGQSETIMFEKYGDAVSTEIEYQITYHGVINRTVFSNLSAWVATYPSTRRLQDAATPSPTLKYGNTLNLQMTPPGNDAVTTATIVMEDGSDQVGLTLDFVVEPLECEQGGECPTTYAECRAQGLGYQIELLTCRSAGSSDCIAMYPYVAWLMVYRSGEACKIHYPPPSTGGLPHWLWWVLIAALVFLLFLSWLVYRTWWKQKKEETEIDDVRYQLDEQIADNKQGLHMDLDAGDMIFNGLATGVPGYTKPMDAVGNELHQRQLEQQNEMAHVQVETFTVRWDYGQNQQNAIGPRGDRNS
eukprot:21560_1